MLDPPRVTNGLPNPKLNGSKFSKPNNIFPIKLRTNKIIKINLQKCQENQKLYSLTKILIDKKY